MAATLYVLSILDNTSFEDCMHGRSILCLVNLGKHKLRGLHAWPRHYMSCQSWLIQASRSACIAAAFYVHRMPWPCQSWLAQASRPACMATAFFVLSILANTSFEACCVAAAFYVHIMPWPCQSWLAQASRPACIATAFFVFSILANTSFEDYAFYILKCYSNTLK